MAEFDYKQRPTTPEYRENWERVYGYAGRTGGDRNRARVHRAAGDPAPHYRLTLQDIEAYPNGCPIISEGPQRDDL